MTIIVTGIRLQVEGSGAFVGQLKDVKAELHGAATAEKTVAAAAADAASGTRALATSAESAATTMRAAASAANENTTALRQARAAGDQYAAMAAQLRSELDPMYVVQQRFDHELERADVLFRAGAISAREYAAAQQLANDNLRTGSAAIFASGTGAQKSSEAMAQGVDAVGTSSRLARHHVQNLAFQFQDLGLQMAAAAGSSAPLKLAMMALLQQGSQISGVMMQAGIGVRGLAGEIGGMISSFASAHPVIAAVAGVAAVGAASLAIFTSELNDQRRAEIEAFKDSLGLTAKEMAKLGEVSITTGDVMKGLGTTIQQQLGVDVPDVLGALKETFSTTFKYILRSQEVLAAGIYAGFVGTFNGVRDTWAQLPAVFGDAAFSAANLAIKALNFLLAKGADYINRFSAMANSVLGLIPGGDSLRLGAVTAPQIEQLTNPFAGAGAKAANTFVAAMKSAYGQAMSAQEGFFSAWGDNAFDAMKKRVTANARDKGLLDDDAAKSSGSRAGKKAGESAAEAFQKAFAAAMKGAAKFADELGKALGVDRAKQTTTMWNEIAANQADAVVRLTASARANAEWNDQLRDTVRLLDQIGGFGSTLGDIGAALVALRTGDFSGLRGSAGLLLKTFSGIQWSGSDDQGHYTRTLGDVFSKALDKVFGSNGSFAQLLQGAGLGLSSSRILLGDRGTGGSIGGAIGGALGGKLGEQVLAGGLDKITKGLGSFAGPLGSILGGVFGSVLGGLFKSTTKGYAVVTNNAVTAGGNNNQLVQQAASSGSGLQSTISQIAQQLGASVGNYSVSIGKRSSGWISVSASGSSQVADKSWKQANVGGDLIYDGKDEAAAIAVAISNAIADGAISGISQKVQAALLSTKDIDSALREAVKVQDVELALGGVQAALEKEFRSFEQTAKERLTLAQKYGFDIVEVEKLNAKERLALNDKLLKEQVGSLQDLIDEMTSGSLFEGSAVDQRNALLAKISAAQADANAGVEGAADKLASLYQQLNSVSKDAYGTTGGFAADRQTIIDGAKQAIAAASARVAAADKATDPALQTTNSLLDESAAQLAKIAALMGLTVDQLKELNDNADKTDLSWLRGLAGY